MDYYKYWEEFVAQWYKNTNNAIMGWSNPDEEPAPLCNTKGGEKSSLYIPEPWWGNDGKQPLHSVVVNFNPGGGGELQKREKVPYHNSYADDIVNKAGETGKISDIWPKNTVWWHFTLRARPVHNTLGLKPSLKSHLSIELIPWHTKNVKEDDNAAYEAYLKHNIKAVYEHSICFAAHESRRIVGNLNKVVFLRENGSFIKLLLNDLEVAGCCRCPFEPEIKDVDSKGMYMEFKLDTLPDIRFISIWGKTTQNKFPVSQMEQIFTELKLLP